jgi:hypothetical protein
VTAFWGYAGADWLCGIAVAVASAACLLAALWFVSTADE